MLASASDLIIGVDGGGTACRVAVGTLSDGILVSREGLRASVASDREGAIQSVLQTVSEAPRAAGSRCGDVAHARAYLGLAGVMSPDDVAAVAAAMPFAYVEVTDDRPTALVGALGEEGGYLLAVGTETIVAARTGGRFRCVGGWGFDLADQASGAWIGRRVLEQALLGHDGIDADTGVTQSLLEESRGEAQGLVAFSFTAKPGNYAAFSPKVVHAAHSGDPVARRIMREGAAHFERGLTALGFTPGERLCLTGGVGPHYAVYLSAETLAKHVEPAGTALEMSA